MLVNEPPNFHKNNAQWRKKLSKFYSALLYAAHPQLCGHPLRGACTNIAAEILQQQEILIAALTQTHHETRHTMTPTTCAYPVP
ncbi:hypothetical protein TGRH88_078350 [Toxoplasma gondii]|uniref:Uncharacterized protein n=1 Tax=Toxoplasma gondii TaxID=5811 RepID=A0A7J6K3H3_TOXGO|nr:hypothetical protein TGRH88_078350 [Toxoplasma gondii]